MGRQDCLLLRTFIWYVVWRCMFFEFFCCFFQTSLMLSLVHQAQSKVAQCDETSNNLQHSLTELESQRDDAKSLIKETFQVG